LQAYLFFIEKNVYFSDLLEEIRVKKTSVDAHQFDKMIVRYREEIVALGKVVTSEQIQDADKQISVDELKRIIEEEDEDWAILDMRNDYEWQL
jgi:predicted sulfurtransferase